MSMKSRDSLLNDMRFFQQMEENKLMKDRMSNV